MVSGDEEYAPLELAATRAKESVYLLQLLVTGRDSENMDLRGPMALRLRRSYLAVVRAYRAHDVKFERGWEIPEWPTIDDVSKLRDRKPVMSWTLDGWLKTEVPKVRARAAFHAAVIEHVRNDKSVRRPERRTLNAIMALFGKEADYVGWTLDVG